MKPRIGIRPTIDGRWGGVRESLEEKTMAMANAAKELIESNVHYQDGTPVECVISPCTIGSGAEAAKCNDYFFNTKCMCNIGCNTMLVLWFRNNGPKLGYSKKLYGALTERNVPVRFILPQ